MLYVERNNPGSSPLTVMPGVSAAISMTKEKTMNGSETPSTPSSSARDYRDELKELLDRAHNDRGLTRYRLCKQMGIDSGTLSNVIAKRRHFSIDKLDQILELLGYRLTFTRNEGELPH
jgi:hypothetical protein